MYKDVWKKFGAKVLIVLCSVLLLGGVAIVAPKLRAAEITTPGSLDLSLADTASKSSIEIVVNSDHAYKEGAEVVPTKITLKDTATGDTWTLAEGTDYSIEVKPGTYTAGTKQVTIVARKGGKIAYNTSGAQYQYTFDYTIDLKQLDGSKDSYFLCDMDDRGKQDVPSSILDPLIITSFPQDVTSGKFSLYYFEKGNVPKNGDNKPDPTRLNEFTEGVDYIKLTENNDFTLSKKTITGFADKSFSVDLKNYRVNTSSVMNINCTPLKRVDTCQVAVNGIISSSFDGDILANGNSTVVYDGEVNYDPATGEVDTTDPGASVVDAGSYEIYRDTDSSYKLRGITPYIGTVTIPLKTTVIDFKPYIVGDYDGAPIDYDENGGSYIKEPTEVRNGGPNGDVVDPANYDVSIELKGADEGRTAGEVVVTVTGKGNYQGSGQKSYFVQRNIANLNALDTVYVEREEGCEQGCVYDMGLHKLTPVVTFKDDAKKYNIAKDCDIDYKLDPIVKNNLTGDDHVKYAGEVAVTVTGNLGATKATEGGEGGYYGVLTGGDYEVAGTYASGLQYTIAQRPIDDGKYSIRLTKTSFELTYSKPPVEDYARVQGLNINGEAYLVNLGEKYATTYWKGDEQITDWSDTNKVTAGKYKIRFTFSGNFKNYIEAEFELQEIDPSLVTVTISDTCEEERITGDAHHTYTGEAHVPTVTAQYVGGSTPTDLTGFKVLYSNDGGKTYTDDPEKVCVDAGTVRIKLELSGGSVTVDKGTEDMQFKIHQRSLADPKGQLKLLWDVESDEDSDEDPDDNPDADTNTNPFSRDENEVAQHEYSGRHKAPTVSNLYLVITGTSGDQKVIPMTAGNASGSDGDFIVKSPRGGLYDTTTNGPISALSDIETENAKYCFRVTGRNNFVNEDGLTENFKFLKRDIASSEIECEPFAMEMTDGMVNGVIDQTKCQNYIAGNLVITDSKFLDNQGKASVLRKPGAKQDYIIEMPSSNWNKIDIDGTIVFNVKGDGCYKGTIRNCVLNVGVDIATTSVKEPDPNQDRTAIAFVDRKRQFEREYRDGGGEDRYLNFSTNSGQTGSDYTRVYDGTTLILRGQPDQTTGKVATDKQYKIEYSKVVFDTSNPTGGRVSCTATLQGVNGYYGTAEIKFWVERSVFNQSDYVIEIPDKLYTGEPIKPETELKVYYVGGGGKELIDNKNNDCYYIIDSSWYQNINANVSNGTQNPSPSNLAQVKIQGINSYSGTLTGYFKILPRPINRENEETMAMQFDMDNWMDRIKYRPYTIIKETDGTEASQTGTWQDITLTFSPDPASKERKPLKYGTKNDYTYKCYNAESAGTAYIEVIGYNNFTGTFRQEYDIDKVSLSHYKNDEDELTESDDFLIQLKDNNDWFKFSGRQIVPTIIVEQIVYQEKGGKQYRYTLKEGVDYTLEPIESVFVSRGVASKSTTYVNILSGTNGKYEGEGRASYTIYGDISPNKNPASATSRLKVQGREDWKDTNYRVPIPFVQGNSVPVAYDRLALVLEQRSYKDDGTLPDWGTEGYKDDYDLVFDTDYTVSCTEQIGYHTAIITGTGNSSNKGNITGEDSIPVTIWASLNDLDTSDAAFPVLWQNNGGTNVIKCTSGSSITEDYLASKLTIKYGTKTLEYPKDYKFVGNVNANLGDFTTIRIEPSDSAGKDSQGNDGYLRGDATIRYKLVSDLTNNAEVPELGTFTYAHGFPVFDADSYDFGIEADGVKLINGTHYDVKITNNKNEPTEPINCGSYKAVISGKGQYGGEIIRTFQIVKYNFTENEAKVRITLESDSVTYTGKAPTLPVVTKVEVYDDNRTDYVEIATEGYTIRAGSNGGDNTNWTDTRDPNVIMPRVEIVGAGNNYMGSAGTEYRITRKSISDPDIEIADILGLEYQNGNEITPYPDITYWINKTAGQEDFMKLHGIRYAEADADKYDNWKEWSTHFTYRYLDNTTTIGEKTIEIVGIGNFTGSVPKTYTVSPLSLKNTKLNFVSEEWPVYDGTEQKPSFEMVYGDVVILKCTNGKVTSDLLMNTGNVRVEFGNNINATDAEHPATIKITMDGSDNYVDFKDAEFTILPASLKDHVKFMYHLKGQKDNTDLRGYKLNLPWVDTETTVQPVFARGIVSESDIEEEQLGIFYDYAGKANHNRFLELEGQRGEAPTGDYRITYKYVEPDSDDVDVREGYGNEHQPPCSYAGKVKVTLEGMGNYTDSASFWYYIGTDISSVGTAKLKTNTTVFNSQIQTPTLILSGITEDECTIAYYKNEAVLENLITKDDFVHAGTYYVRIEGKPWKGTYASKPQTFTYTITARPLSSAIVIDGFKKEYSYTGNPICPVGISVTDYIDRIKYRLTEDVDYSLTYANNLNAGTAVITVVGQNDYSGSATAKFTITSSTISSGGSNNGGSLTDGSGELSGTMAVKPEDVKLSMDTSDAMYYTGNQLRPGVSIAGMTENVDYTVTYSNNVEVGTGVVTITGIKNNTGTITKMFRIIAPLSKCTVAPIPDQQHTGSPVTPTVTIRCGNSILVEGTDYTVSYANNINIGTATVTIRSANNSNYTGSTTATFHIGNNIGSFIISGYAPSYTYTGKAITPGVVVESGNSRLTQGVDYTVSYSNNTNAGIATITVTGIGKYSGTQTANFIIEGKNIETCDTTDVSDKTYTGDAYTPSITVSDNGTVLKNGVDYILTYVNNTNPGTASILVQGMSNNYVGTKIISFKIAGVPIKGLKAATVKYNSIKLSWTKQSYADGYQICDSKSKVVKNVTKNSATITKLSAGKTYKYKVRSYIRNSDGSRSYGAFSPVLSTTTKLKTPSVKITSTKKGQARISWSKVSGATGYEIYYKKSKSAKYKKLKTINKANVRICTVRGLKSGDRCYFRVRAFKKSGSKKVYSALNPLKVITIK